MSARVKERYGPEIFLDTGVSLLLMAANRSGRKERKNQVLLLASFAIVTGLMGAWTAVASAESSPQKLIVPAGTEFTAELVTDLDSRLISEEERVVLRVNRSVLVGASEAIPRGARIICTVSARQDEEGNYSTLVLAFRELSRGMRSSLPIAVKVTALEPPPPPGEVRTPGVEGERWPGEPERRPGEPRRPRIETSGGISIRKIPDERAEGKPSKIGMRREDVELMKVSHAESGETEITLQETDIALRPGTRFRLVLVKDLVIN